MRFGILFGDNYGNLIVMRITTVLTKQFSRYEEDLMAVFCEAVVILLE